MTTRGRFPCVCVFVCEKRSMIQEEVACTSAERSACLFLSDFLKAPRASSEDANLAEYNLINALAKFSNYFQVWCPLRGVLTITSVALANCHHRRVCLTKCLPHHHSDTSLLISRPRTLSNNASSSHTRKSTGHRGTVSRRAWRSVHVGVMSGYCAWACWRLHFPLLSLARISGA